MILPGWLLLAALPTTVAVLPGGAAFTLEVAETQEARQQGYMWRERVGAFEGMLFVFSDDAVHPIWMKNCRVDLDVVWLDAAHRVVEIVTGATPCPADGECPSIVPRAPSRSFIEFAAGTVARESLKVGDTITILRGSSPR